MTEAEREALEALRDMLGNGATSHHDGDVIVPSAFWSHCWQAYDRVKDERRPKPKWRRDEYCSIKSGKIVMRLTECEGELVPVIVDRIVDLLNKADPA